MAITFPTDPTNGQEFTANGIVYVYDATAGLWDINASSSSTGTSGIPVSDNPPTNPVEGDQWFSSELLETFIYYVDDNGSYWVKSNPSSAVEDIDVPTDINDLTDTSGVIPSDVGDLTDTGGILGAGGGGTTTYADMAALVAETGMSDGDQAFVLATNNLYIYKTNGWFKIATVENLQPGSISGVDASYSLAIDGTPTVITATATDPEGFPLTWSYAVTTGSLGSTATVSQADNVFTITPSTTEADAGDFSITFSVTDGVNGAVNAVSSFTLEFVVQNSSYTTALITTDGSAGDNNDITDSSTNSHTVTVNGDAHATTFSPYKHGGYSVEFDGTDDYLTILDSSLELAGEFTITFWLHLNLLKDFQTLFHWSDFTGNGTGYDNDIYISGTGAMNSRIRTTSAQPSTNTISAGQWYYLTVTRNSSNVIKVWVDGSEEISYTGSGTLDNYISIGFNPFSGGRNYLDGYIRDFCIKDVAVSSPTIPSEPVASDSNTKLLTCHLPYLADGSSSNLTVSVSGPIISPFTPYDHNGYVEADHGGSISFDGTGDYFTIADSTDFDLTNASSWTMEGWAYREGDTTNEYLVSQGVQAVNGSYISNISFQGINSGVVANCLMIQIYHGNNKIVLTTPANSIRAKVWHYIVVQYNSSSGWSAYIDGKNQTLTPLAAQSQAASSTDWGWTNSSLPSGPLYFGARSYTDGGDSHVNGHMADWKWTASIQYTSDFTPPTSPSPSTNALFHVKGTDAHVIDKSQSSKIVKLDGAVASTAQTKYADASIYFDGTDDYITTNSPVLGTQDFTIETWVYFNSWDDNNAVFGFGSSNQYDWGMSAYSSELTLWRTSPLVRYTILDQTEIQNLNGTWVHLAVVNDTSSNTKNVYVNGTLEFSQAGTLDFTNTSEVVEVGRHLFDSTRAAKYLDGYIEDFRVTKGLARYTANFTPLSGSLKG